MCLSIVFFKTRVCLLHSGSRPPDRRLQTQTGGAEPGPRDPGRLSAAGCHLGGPTGARRTQFWGTLELLAGLGTAGRQKVGNSWGVDWIGSRWRRKGWELWQRSGRGRRRRGSERGGCPLRLEGSGTSWRRRRCELRAPQRLAERSGRPRCDDFEAGPIGCRRWRGEALHLTHSRRLLRTALHPVLLIGG